MIILIPIIILAVILLSVFLPPRTSSTTKTITFDATIDEVWQVYTEPEKQPDWRPDVGQISMSSDGQSWTETLKQGGITIHFEIIEKTPPHKFVLKTGTPNNFEGKYIAEFQESGNQTIGTFTEEATTLGFGSKILRFLFVRQEKLIDDYAAHAKAEIMRRRTAA